MTVKFELAYRPIFKRSYIGRWYRWWANKSINL